MSDEMVQETTETANTVAPDGISTETPSELQVTSVPVASAVVAQPAMTEEPAPAQPVAPETVIDTHAPTPPAGTETGEFEKAMLNFDAQFDQSLQQLQQDTVVIGTVMRIDRGEVLVDVGAKSEGIIRLNELSRQGTNATPESIVTVGEKIKVYVMEAENQEGIPILSKKRADFELAWDQAQVSKETGETIKAIVTDRVKGGLVVDMGIRGFVPASHVGNGSLRTNLEKYIGQEILLKVIEVDKERHKVVLSNKMAMTDERDSKSAETKASLAPGQIRRGMVRRLTAYGAFIDLGGIDGLLHISEMSWTRINDPKEILKEGQELDVQVLKTDLENNRVSLGLRQILPDPWIEIPNLYKDGDTITGVVTRLVPFGVFVQVKGGIEGIIPNSELPRNRNGKNGAPIAVGEEVTVKVIGLQPENRKMTLSLRALLPPEEDAPMNREPREPRGDNREPREPRGDNREPREARPDNREPREPRPDNREPREPRPPRDAGAPSTANGAGASAPGGSAAARSRRPREDRDERDDFPRYRPEQEPRFTIGDAFAAATKTKERARRERRKGSEQEEDEIDLNDISIDETQEVAESAETEEKPSQG